MTLNESAMVQADVLAANAPAWRCAVSLVGGARVIDCGGAVAGGLQAGLQLARVCTAGLADISLQAGPDGPLVQVVSDDPVRACLAAQYAGWQIKTPGFFAMGSGPMRAAVGREALFNDIPGRERPPCAVGVLETRKHPTEEAIAYVVSQLPITAEKLTLAVAPVKRIAPCPRGSMRFAACCVTRKPPNAVTARARCTALGSSSASGPWIRAEAL